MKQKFHYQNEHDKNAIISYALLLLQHYGFRAEHDQKLKRLSKGKASVGVAIIHNDDIIAIANEDKYPTMSVFKFHIAVTALKKWKQRIFRWTKWCISNRKKC